MSAETVPSAEITPDIDDLRFAVAQLIEKEGLEVDSEDMDFLFTDGETGEPRDFGEVEGAVIGWLNEQGYDGHEVLAAAGILEPNEQI